MIEFRFCVLAGIVLFVAALQQGSAGFDIEQAKQLANAGATTSTKLHAEAQSAATSASPSRRPKQING